MFSSLSIGTFAIMFIVALSSVWTTHAQLPEDCSYNSDALDPEYVMNAAQSWVSRNSQFPVGDSSSIYLQANFWGMINKGGVQHEDGGASCIMPRIVDTAKLAGMRMSQRCANTIAAAVVTSFNNTSNTQVEDCDSVSYVVSISVIAPFAEMAPPVPPAAVGGRLYSVYLFHQSPNVTMPFKPNDPKIDQSPDMCTYLPQNVASSVLSAPVSEAIDAADVYFNVANPNVLLYTSMWGVLAPAVDKRKDRGLACISAQMATAALSVTVDIDQACINSISKTAFATKPGTVSDGKCQIKNSKYIVKFQVTTSVVKNVLILGKGVGVVYTLFLGKQLPSTTK